MHDKRTEKNKRDPELEKILEMVNNVLQDDESDLIRSFSKPQLPGIFIVGNPRSGTTLTYQWLAGTGNFSYPSNIMSRFYNAPFFGALIHKMLITHDKHGEFFSRHDASYASHLGKTVGANAPHEFWYFWRRFFKFSEIQRLSDHELRSVDAMLFLKELAAIESCFQRPLLMKAMIMNWNLEFLHSVLPMGVFCFVQRNVIDNMYSLYKTRIEFSGDVRNWYSFKLPEYHDLKDQDVYTQLAGQVILTNKSIQNTLSSFPESSRLTIPYDEFCERPAIFYHRLQAIFHHHGYTLPAYDGSSSFKNTGNKFEFGFDVVKAEQAVAKFI